MSERRPPMGRKNQSSGDRPPRGPSDASGGARPPRGPRPEGGGNRREERNPFAAERGHLDETRGPRPPGAPRPEGRRPFQGQRDDRRPFAGPQGQREDRRPFHAPQGQREDRRPFNAPPGQREDRRPFAGPQGQREDRRPFNAPQGQREDRRPFDAPQGQRENRSFDGPPRRDEERRPYTGSRRNDDRLAPPPRDERRPRDDDRARQDDGGQAPMRRALVNVGGPTREEGDPRFSSTLAAAMDAAANEDPDALTHGFHAWPARMHRAIARTVIERATKPGERVLDPFCGSGTVLLEAMVAGRRSAGVDLNPLACPLVHVKCERRDAASRARFLDVVMSVGEASVERVRAREPVIADLPGPMLGWYGPHVLKEMAGLLAEIRSVEDEADRRAMEMVFSSLVVKLSRRRAETSTKTNEVEKRIRKGLTTELFVRKSEELVTRWASLESALPADAHPPRVFEGDALALRSMLGDRTKAQLVLTSPPYGGTYDYHEQHALRLAWLGMDARRLEQGEIGARRGAIADQDEAAQRWDHDVGAMLGSISSVLEIERTCVLLMGDGRFGRHHVPLLPQLLDIAPRFGMRMIASASQPRSDWGFGRVREEHLVALRKVD